MSDNRQTVIALDKKRMQAMASNDVLALNELIADDVIYTHSTGQLDSKADLIGSMQSGALVYQSLEASDVMARDLGDTVVLTGIARARVHASGKSTEFGVRFTDVWALRSGRWQMLVWQSTKLPE